MSGKKGSKWNCGLIRLLKQSLSESDEVVLHANAVVGKLSTFIKYCKTEGLLIITRHENDPVRMLYLVRSAAGVFGIVRKYVNLTPAVEPLREGVIPLSIRQLEYTETFQLKGGFKMLDRIGDWTTFSVQVGKHVKQYTIPQYQSEDAESDQVGAWTAEECATAMKRYLNRFGKGARGSTEALRDMLKVAHYSQLCYDKLREELSVTNIYE